MLKKVSFALGPLQHVFKRLAAHLEYTSGLIENFTSAVAHDPVGQKQRHNIDWQNQHNHNDNNS